VNIAVGLTLSGVEHPFLGRGVILKSKRCSALNRARRSNADDAQANATFFFLAGLRGPLGFGIHVFNRLLEETWRSTSAGCLVGEHLIMVRTENTGKQFCGGGLICREARVSGPSLDNVWRGGLCSGKMRR
jgi:hypothetical protein